jgi:hypothetical protein
VLKVPQHNAGVLSGVNKTQFISEIKSARISYQSVSIFPLRLPFQEVSLPAVSKLFWKEGNVHHL